MKINTLMGMARRQRICRIHRDAETGRQWLAVGGGLYPMDGLPEMDKNMLLVMMDVPEHKQDDYSIKCVGMTGQMKYLTADNSPEDRDAMKDGGITISWNGVELLPIYTNREGENRMILVQAEYLRPIADEERNYQLYTRMVDGHPYLLVKKGFGLIAAIARVVISDKDAVETLDDISMHIKKDIMRYAVQPMVRETDGQEHI